MTHHASDERYRDLALFAESIARARYEDNKRPVETVQIALWLPYGTGVTPTELGGPLVIVPRGVNPMRLNWRWAADLDLRLIASGRRDSAEPEFAALAALMAIQPRSLVVWYLHSGRHVAMKDADGHRGPWADGFDRTACPEQWREWVYGPDAEQGA
jgi:hypothetical protein